MRFLGSPKNLPKFRKLTIAGLISLIIIISIILISRNHMIDRDIKKFVPPFTFLHQHELKLVLQKTYVTCKHVEVMRKTFDAVKTLKAYADVHGYTLHKSGRKQRVSHSIFIYTKQSPGLCEICQNNQFLGIRSRQVAVIHGIPQKPGPVQESTGIDVNNLPESEALDLKKGISFKDDKEKLQLIEGLIGLFTN